MYKDFRKPGRGPERGGKSFGDRKPWERGSQGGNFQRAEMHKATCADCGNVCAVPFRPNGRKPVYCSDCFKKEGNAEPRRFGGEDNRRGGGDERRPFSHDRPQHDRFEQRPPQRDTRTEERLDQLNAKLDSIIKTLAHMNATQLTKEEHALDGEDIIETVVKAKKVAKKKKKE